MSQSVWHKHEIENVLRGVELTCLQMAAQSSNDEIDSFKRGFLAALAATATSFGIRVNDMRVRPRSGPLADTPARLSGPGS